MEEEKTKNEKPQPDNKLLTLLQNESNRLMNAEALALSSLRRAISRGILQPGQEIDEEEIAKHLSISRMPVRQAMGILENEGLVKRTYRKGVVVSGLTPQEIEEIYNIRANLEGWAVRKAVPHYTDEYIRQLRNSLYELEKHERDFEKHTEYNHRFHVMLYEPSNWNRLIGIIVQLRNNTMRYRMLSDQHFYSHEPVESDYSHEKILEACEKRNEEEAERLNREHILNAMRIVLGIVNRD